MSTAAVQIAAIRDVLRRCALPADDHVASDVAEELTRAGLLVTPMSTDVDELVAALHAARTEIERLRAERARARARIAELTAVVDSLHYRMTCVDPPPDWDEIVDTLARARKDADR